ncbi:MAG: hypothetical protein MUC48_07295 [Leptolyngbya sp. Prado105]|nr:hypothetical protein [Leptolyngbya sp. Prado105]
MTNFVPLIFVNNGNSLLRPVSELDIRCGRNMLSQIPSSCGATPNGKRPSIQSGIAENLGDGKL